jgi:hypothetical protein
MGNELAVIVGCFESIEFCKPEMHEIFKPLTTPLKVALLHIIFPDGSTEQLSFLKVPVKIWIIDVKFRLYL